MLIGAWKTTLLVFCLILITSSCSDTVRPRNPHNTYLPQLLAVSGVISTGERSHDEAMQRAVAEHLQGWFANASSSFAVAAGLSPTNRDIYLGAAYTAQLNGCSGASRSLRSFLRLYREQGSQDRRDVRCKRAPTKEHNAGGNPELQRIRVWVDNGIFVSIETFRSMANHVFDEYFCHFDPRAVRPGDIVFVNTFLLCPFVEVFHPQISVPYALITHNSDFSAPAIAPGFDFSSLLDHPRLLAWFAQNPSTLHPKLHPLPQGLPVNTKTFSVDWHPGLAYMAKTLFSAPDMGHRPKWLYVNFDARGEPRREASIAWATQPEQAAYVTVRASKVGQAAFAEEVSLHRFVLCPPGNGLDTHRVYEALQLGAVPVVFASQTLEPLYARLPVLRVDAIEDASLHRLRDAFPPLLARMRQMWEDEERSPLTARYWERAVRSIVEGQLSAAAARHRRRPAG